MHGLANILTDNPSLQLTNELQEFSQVLSSVQNGLNQAIQEGHGELLGTNMVTINRDRTPPPRLFKLAARSPHRVK